MSVESTVGTRIKKLRNDAGLKQVEFSKSVMVSQGYLAEVEKGKKIPSQRVIFAIGQRYGISEKWLRDGRGQKTAESFIVSDDERKLVTKLRELRTKYKDKSALAAALMPHLG